MRRPRIQVLLDNTGLTSNVHDALRRLEAQVECFPLSTSDPVDASGPADARLVITSDGPSAQNNSLGKIHEWFDCDPCATLVLCEARAEPQVAPSCGSNGRAIGFAFNLSKDDLAGRLAAMCALRGPMENLRRERDTLKSREKLLRSNLRQVENELRRASVFQHDLLPATLPEVKGLRVHTLYRPADVVSGDMYGAVRLDDAHGAYSRADATGHGLAAGLLCAFVKRLLDGRETFEAGRSRLEPDEVLARLNRALCDAQLPECQFIAAFYILYDERTRSVRWARGGVPYPILARRGDRPRQITSAGPIVGVSPDATFELMELQLAPGDTLVFHSDGLDALLLDPERGPGGDSLEGTSWFQSLGSRPIGDNLRELGRRRASAEPGVREIDDLTVLALHVPEVATVGTGADDSIASAALCVAGT